VLLYFIILKLKKNTLKLFIHFYFDELTKIGQQIL